MRIPPASFTPRSSPVVSSKSRTASSITSATGGVADTDELAGGRLDEVAAGEQGEPGRAAHVVERRKLCCFEDDFQMSAAAGLLGGDDLVEDLQVMPGQERPAIDHHVDLGGAGRHRVADVVQLRLEAGPSGREGGGHTGDRHRTAAQAPRPRSRPGRGRRRPRRPTAPSASVGSGRTALAHSERTLPGVSAPSRVVRSTMLIAVSIAHALAVVLMLRVASPAARPSAPTWSTPGRPCRKRRSVALSRVDVSQCGTLQGGHRASLGARGSGLGCRAVTTSAYRPRHGRRRASDRPGPAHRHA